MTEIWLPCDESSHYEVSSLGRVRSLDRYVNHPGGGKKLCAGKMLSICINSSGYGVIMLRNGISGRTVSVHRLVAKAFADGYFDGADVNHIDGDKMNNVATNLEWVSRSENITHAYQTLKRPHYLRDNKKRVSWITDGSATRRLLGDFKMPEGWRTGRTTRARVAQLEGN